MRRLTPATTSITVEVCGIFCGSGTNCVGGSCQPIVCASPLVLCGNNRGGVRPDIPVQLSRTIPGLEALGPTHGVEMPYVFGTVTGTAGPAGPEDQALSDLIQGYWARFARYGDPKGDSAAEWPQLDEVTKPVMSFDVQSTLMPGFRRAECDFWRAIYDAEFR